MSKYELFRNRSGVEGAAESAKIANFIENSLSSTTIYHSRLSKNEKAVLTREHKEGNIEIILFTYPLKPASKIIVGDYIKHNNKNFLTFMEYDHPLSEHYHKFKVLECNITIKVDDLELPAAYFSAMRSFVTSVSVNMAGSANLFENMRPVVVVKDDPALKVNFRFLAAGEGYKVVNIDRISNPGIAYLSLEQAPLNIATDDLTEGKVTTYQPVDPGAGRPGAPVFKKGEVVTYDIYNGFVSFSPRVEVVNRTANEVTFRVPYDIDKLTVTTKDGEETIIDEREVV